MTIIERALDLVTNDSRVGLGSGHAAQAFVRALGERVRRGCLRVQGVPTSEETASLARKEGIPLLSLAEAGSLDLTLDLRKGGLCLLEVGTLHYGQCATLKWLLTLKQLALLG